MSVAAPPARAVGRMYTKAGSSVDKGTALAADLKIKPSYDETARVGGALTCKPAAAPASAPAIAAPAAAKPPESLLLHGPPCRP